MSGTKLKLRSQLAIVLFVLLDALLLLIVAFQIPPATGIYFWSSLVWFSWYLYARTFVKQGRHCSLKVTAEAQAT
jgi:hypothetical protein